MVHLGPNCIYMWYCVILVYGCFTVKVTVASYAYHSLKLVYVDEDYSNTLIISHNAYSFFICFIYITHFKQIAVITRCTSAVKKHQWNE